MRYDTTNVEVLEQSATAIAARRALTALEEALLNLGGHTPAFDLVVDAKAETQNWLRYLNLGGFAKLGKYEPIAAMRYDVFYQRGAYDSISCKASFPSKEEAVEFAAKLPHPSFIPRRIRIEEVSKELEARLLPCRRVIVETED